jgi:hypothetical protein
MDVDCLQVDTETTRCFGHPLRSPLPACRRIVQYAEALGVRKQLLQHLDFLRIELGRKDAPPPRVRAIRKPRAPRAGLPTPLIARERR